MTDRRIVGVILHTLALGAAAPAQAATGPPVVAGLATNGPSLVTNATVFLYADPPPSFWASIVPGQVVPRDLIGTANTGASGAYSISVSNWPAVLADADSNGVVNLAVESYPKVGVSGLSARFNFSRQVVTMADGSLALAVDPYSDGSNGGVDLTAQQADLAMHPTSTPGIPPPCGLEVLIADVGQRLVTVGGGFTQVSGVHMDFKYGEGQESALGVGVNLGNGTWGLDGTVDKQQTSDNFQGWGSHTSSTFFRTDFEWGQFAESCSGGEEHAMHWNGGASHSSPAAPAVNTANCVHEDAGSNWTQDFSNATTYAGGASVSGDIGINLSAHTGYSHTGAIHIHNDNAGRLCGTNSKPALTPKRLVFIGP